MVRDQWSYWLTITSSTPLSRDEAEAIIDRVKAESDGVLCFTSDLPEPAYVLSFEVDPDVGTVDQRDEFFDLVQKWSREDPDLGITLKGIDEDDHSNERFMRCVDGKVVVDNDARLVESDVPWDKSTVEAVVQALSTDYPDAADFVRIKFLNTNSL